MDKTSHLGEIMNTFGTDTKGALDVLTREVTSLRFDAIGGLRRAWELEKVRNQHDSKQTLQESLDLIGRRADEFEEDVRAKLGGMEKMMPQVRGDVNALMRRSEAVEAEVKRAGDLGKSNSRDIRSLFDAQGRMDEAVVRMEDQVAGVKNDVGRLKEGEAEGRKLIERLQHRLDDSEEREKGLKQQLEDTIKYFEAELGSMRRLVVEQGGRLDEVEGAAAEERVYVRNLEGRLDEEDRDIRGMVEFLGVVKPKMELMVEACLPFEQLSYYKKYCPPINTPLLDINIPNRIAGFGVVMAAWIAFKADSEALRKVVSGVNPEEIVYADEDIELRRRSLLSEFNASLRSELEERSPSAGALRPTGTPMCTANSHTPQSSSALELWPISLRLQPYGRHRTQPPEAIP